MANRRAVAQVGSDPAAVQTLEASHGAGPLLFWGGRPISHARLWHIKVWTPYRRTPALPSRRRIRPGPFDEYWRNKNGDQGLYCDALHWPQAPGVNEAWNEAAGKLFNEAEFKAAGGTGWRITNDVFGNSPRTQFTVEYETVEQAIAAYVGPKSMEIVDGLLKLGTLDFEISVHKLSREG